MSRNAKTDQPKGGITVRRGVAAVFGALLITTSALAAVTLVRLASDDGAAAQAAMNQGAGRASQPALNNPAKAGATLVTTPPVGAAQEESDEVRIALSARGFAQSEVTHAAGSFALAVENQGVTDEYVLQLKGPGGVLLNEIKVQRGSAVWTVDLQVGIYTLMVANHPDWVCQITVQ